MRTAENTQNMGSPSFSLSCHFLWDTVHSFSLSIPRKGEQVEKSFSQAIWLNVPLWLTGFFFWLSKSIPSVSAEYIITESLSPYYRYITEMHLYWDESFPTWRLPFILPVLNLENNQIAESSLSGNWNTLPFPPWFCGAAGCCYRLLPNT